MKDQAFNRLYGGLKVIGYMAAPHVGHIHDFAPRLARLIEKLEGLKFPTVGALPLLAGVIGLDRDQVESRLRQSLVSTDEHAIDAALDDIFEWAKWEKARSLGEVPPDLLTELANIIASRRRPGLLIALRVAKFIAHRRHDLIAGRTIMLLRTGLDYLSVETRYEPYSDEPAGRSITYPEVTRFREEAAALALALQNIAELRDDPVIRSWVDRARNDPLPELRRLEEEGEALIE